MMNYISKRDKLELTAPKALASGELVAIGAKVVVAQGAAENGAKFIALTEGVVKGTLKAGDAPTELQKMYLNENGELTVSEDDGGDPAVAYVFAGYCAKAATGELLLAD